MSMLGLYRAGTSVLHRMPAGAKLLALLVLVLALTIPPPTPWLLGVGILIVVVLYLVSGLGMRELVRQVLAIRWLILIVTVSQLLFLAIPDVVANTTRMIVVIILAALVTLTTRTSDILDALHRVMTPLAHFGVNPWRVSLVLALTIRTVPVISGLAEQLRDAQRARGGRTSIRAYVVPLLVQSLRHSDDLADALNARGVE